MSVVVSEYTSDCCGATMYDDCDICSECGEHTSGYGICEKCMGKGEVMGETKKETCPECQGEGGVVIDL